MLFIAYELHKLYNMMWHAINSKALLLKYKFYSFAELILIVEISQIVNLLIDRIGLVMNF